MGGKVSVSIVYVQYTVIVHVQYTVILYVHYTVIVQEQYTAELDKKFYLKRMRILSSRFFQNSSSQVRQKLDKTA